MPFFVNNNPYRSVRELESGNLRIDNSGCRPTGGRVNTLLANGAAKQATKKGVTKRKRDENKN